MSDASIPASDRGPANSRDKSGATRRRDDISDDEKIGFFASILRFIRETINEMRKVKYPSGQELWLYFVVVIVFVAILMAYTGLIDFGADRLSKLVFG